MNVEPGFGNDVSGGALTVPAVSGGIPQIALLQFPSQPGFTESTILRIRGSLTVPKSVYDPTANTTKCLAFGIGVVSDTSAEALAVPNPATATGYDWDGWLFIRQSNLATVESQATVVDVKAMRKWKSGDSIVFVCGSATGGSAANADFGWSLRGLFLLP